MDNLINFSSFFFKIRCFLVSIYRRLFKGKKRYSDLSVSQQAASLLGPPRVPDKIHFTYASSHNQNILATGDIKKSRYMQSFVGMSAYLRCREQIAFRDNLINIHANNIRQSIISVTGYDNVSFGAIADVQKVASSDNTNFHDIKLTFSSGAVAQFILAVPEKRNGKMLIAIHGNSSSPDNVMGIDDRDYSNRFGYEAYKLGYIVIAPHSVMQVGNWTDRFSMIGATTSGITTHGYEMMKVMSIVDYVTNHEQIEYTDKCIWGISSGGLIATLLANIEPSFRKVVISGAIYDYRKRWLRLLDLPMSPRTSRAFYISNLFRYVSITDLVTNIFPRTVIVEIGSEDIRPGTLEAMKDIIAYNNEMNYNALKINFFLGYHETNPKKTLDLLDDNLNN